MTGLPINSLFRLVYIEDLDTGEGTVQIIDNSGVVVTAHKINGSLLPVTEATSNVFELAVGSSIEDCLLKLNDIIEALPDTSISSLADDKVIATGSTTDTLNIPPNSTQSYINKYLYNLYNPTYVGDVTPISYRMEKIGTRLNDELPSLGCIQGWNSYNYNGTIYSYLFAISRWDARGYDNNNDNWYTTLLDSKVGDSIAFICATDVRPGLPGQVKQINFKVDMIEYSSEDDVWYIGTYDINASGGAGYSNDYFANFIDLYFAILTNSSGNFDNVYIKAIDETRPIETTNTINTELAYQFDGVNALVLSKGTNPEYRNTFVGVETGGDPLTIDNSTAIGYQAGMNNSGIASTAVGSGAGNGNTGTTATAIGYDAGNGNTGFAATSVGSAAGANNTGSHQVAVGYNAGQTNIGDDQVAIGYSAGQSNSGINQVVVGFAAGQNNTAATQVAIGLTAGVDNTGGQQVAIGDQAGSTNTGGQQVAIGLHAGKENSGHYQIALGYDAGLRNTNSNQVALGQQAGRDNAGDRQISVGQYTGATNSGIDQIAIGYFAGHTNTQDLQIAIGIEAGRNNEGVQQVALGQEAGKDNTGGQQAALGIQSGKENTGYRQIAIGYWAGKGNSNSNQIAIGDNAGRNNKGSNQIAIGILAGDGNELNIDDQICIGKQAGESNAGGYQVAVGTYAGQYNEGLYEIAIGYNAGRVNTGRELVAIGYSAGESNDGEYCTQLGSLAGKDNAADYQIAMGYQAGRDNAITGTNQIAIGNGAGSSNTGADNISIGNAANNTTGSFITAVGKYAGQGSSGTNVVCMGQNAGNHNSGDNCVLIGHSAGAWNTDDGKLIIKQDSLNFDPLIEGDFATGDVKILGKLTAASSTLDSHLITQGQVYTLLTDYRLLANNTFTSRVDIDFASYYKDILDDDGDIEVYGSGDGIRINNGGLVTSLQLYDGTSTYITLTANNTVLNCNGTITVEDGKTLATQEYVHSQSSFFLIQDSNEDVIISSTTYGSPGANVTPADDNGLVDFTYNGTLTYTGTEVITIDVQADISYNSTGTNRFSYFYWARNWTSGAPSVSEARGIISRKTSAAEVVTTVCSMRLELNPGDTLDLICNNDDGTETVTFQAGCKYRGFRSH